MDQQERQATSPAAGERTMGRWPEGPPHPRSTSLGQTLKRTASEFKEDDGVDCAAALTYYSVLSVFPGLIALVSVVGLFADPEQLTRDLIDIVRQFAPSSTAKSLRRPIEDITADRETAGVLLVVGLVGALWTASGYVGAFTRASNRIYEVEEGRSVFKLRPLQMLVTFLQVVLLALVAAALIVSGPIAEEIGDGLGIGSTVTTAWDIVKIPVMVGVVLLAISLLYYASPNAKLRGFRSVLPGAVLAVVVWAVASALFVLYVANLGSYNATYGTLGGVIVFLVWLWITNVAIVLGAEFNAERERSAEFDDRLPGAERELQIDLRGVPKPKKRSRTA